MKIAELSGRELDAWVAKAEGYVHRGAIGIIGSRKEGERYCLSEGNDWWDAPEGHWICGPCEGFPYRYSTEWERGGPIIERRRIHIVHVRDMSDPLGHWMGGIENRKTLIWGDIQATGDTALIAAMRCYVASEFPEEFAQ